MTLGQLVTQNLRAARIKRKYSQEALAHRAGISVSYVSMLERGQRSPPLETLEILAHALGVPAVSLLQSTRQAAKRRS